jgi:putative N-acetyltransferase (TIGR04045 family)
MMPLAATPPCDIRPVRHPHERHAAAALRHLVFCVEQRLFTSDRDEIDRECITIVAVTPDRDVVGTVRIHEAAPALWFGSRLAVAPSWRRRAGLGAGLIAQAVGLAHGLGCRRFLAHVQAANVELFTSLHWQALEFCDLHGKPHCLMQADLDHYPKRLMPALQCDKTA